MFKQINKTDRHNNNGVALIKTETIVGITEIATEPTKLYDQDGNLVSEEPSPRKFVIAVNNGNQTYNLPFTIDETTYNDLVAELTK